MKSGLRIFIICIVVSWTTGCAMKSVYDIGPDKVLGSLGGVSVIVEDSRPMNEKEQSYGSFIIGSSDYGIWTLGDKSFTPSPMEVLRQRVLESVSQKSDKPSSIKINVQHLVIQDNQQAYLLKDGSASLGPLGIAIAEAMHGQKFEFDYDKTLPFVVAFLEAEVVVDGAVRKITLSKANNYSSNVDAEGRDKATRKTASEFFGELGIVLVE